MGTLYDYLKWRGDLTFTEAPPNDVDSLIFSLISYIDLVGIVPAEHTGATVSIKAAANAFFAQNPNIRKVSMGLILPKGLVKLFRAVKATRRFKNVEMCAHVNLIDLKQEIQFSATTYLLTPNSMLVAYRGTDDTLIGWKENFNMCFMPVVPSQLHATDYLNEAARNFEGEVRVTGHSKGGNLSVYAAVHADAEVKKKIVRVWSNDGPGFSGGILDDPAYIEMRPLIKTLVPKFSVVGMLLEHEEHYTVVKARRPGVTQHDGLTWSVMGGSFIQVEDVTERSKRTDKTLNQWMKQLTPKQREQFVEAIYQVLSADNAYTLTDLVSIGKNKWLQKTANLDPQVSKAIQKAVAILLETNKQRLLEDFFAKKEK